MDSSKRNGAYLEINNCNFSFKIHLSLLSLIKISFKIPVCVYTVLLMLSCFPRHFFKSNNVTNKSCNITGAWSGTDTLAHCNKVKHDKIIKYIGKLTQERKRTEIPPTSSGVTCKLALAIVPTLAAWPVLVCR